MYTLYTTSCTGYVLLFIRIVQAIQSPDHVQQKFVKSLQRKVNAAITDKSRFPFTDFMVYPPAPALGGLLVRDPYYLRPCFVWVVELACNRYFPGLHLPCPVCKITRGVKRKEWCSRRAILQDGSCDLTYFVYKCTACAKSNAGKPKARHILKYHVLGCLKVCMHKRCAQ